MAKPQNKLKPLPPTKKLNQEPEVILTNIERKKHEEQRVEFEFQFQCEKFPKATYASGKEDHDIISVKVKVKGSSPVSDADKVKIWRDMQKELKKKYFLRYSDIAVFTFRENLRDNPSSRM